MLWSYCPLLKENIVEMRESACDEGSLLWLHSFLEGFNLLPHNPYF